MIREIEISSGTADSCPMAHIEIDGTEYMLCGGTGCVSVIAGRLWIHSRRTMGKTFWSLCELVSHYRRHGKELAEYAVRVATLKA